MDWKNAIDSCSDDIKNCSTKNLFSLEGLVCAANIFHIYDGDSFYMNIIFHNEVITFKCRLAGLDTPEMRSHDELEKSLALIAKQRVYELVDDTIVCVSCGKFDKYGRVLVDITLNTGEDLCSLLIKEKLAFPYDGGKKRTDWASLRS